MTIEDIIANKELMTVESMGYDGWKYQQATWFVEESMELGRLGTALVESQVSSQCDECYFPAHEFERIH